MFNNIGLLKTLSLKSVACCICCHHLCSECQVRHFQTTLTVPKQVQAFYKSKSFRSAPDYLNSAATEVSKTQETAKAIVARAGKPSSPAPPGWAVPAALQTKHFCSPKLGLMQISNHCSVDW